MIRRLAGRAVSLALEATMLAAGAWTLTGYMLAMLAGELLEGRAPGAVSWRRSRRIGA